MASKPVALPLTSGSARPVAKFLVATTTIMLAFISYWRAAAIVLNDLASKSGPSG
jgi:hypothetical protein